MRISRSSLDREIGGAISIGEDFLSVLGGYLESIDQSNVDNLSKIKLDYYLSEVELCLESLRQLRSLFDSTDSKEMELYYEKLYGLVMELVHRFSSVTIEAFDVLIFFRNVDVPEKIAYVPAPLTSQEVLVEMDEFISKLKEAKEGLTRVLDPQIILGMNNLEWTLAIILKAEVEYLLKTVELIRFRYFDSIPFRDVYRMMYESAVSMAIRSLVFERTKDLVSRYNPRQSGF